jgi:Predicted membrane protein
MYRSGEILPSKVIGFIAWGFWRTAGLMLVGMALYNSGFLTLSYSRRLYKRVVLFTVPVGIALTSAGVVYIEMNAWAAESALYWRAFNYWGSMLLGTGYITLIIPYCSSEARTRVQRVLASVGRTALSNYILQSLIATWIFYGYGLGLYGSVNRVEQLGIVLVIWAVQIVVSVLWLRRFQYGPLEWVWRTLTYQSRQPLSK